MIVKPRRLPAHRDCDEIGSGGANVDIHCGLRELRSGDAGTGVKRSRKQDHHRCRRADQNRVDEDTERLNEAL